MGPGEAAVDVLEVLKVPGVLEVLVPKVLEVPVVLVLKVLGGLEVLPVRMRPVDKHLPQLRHQPMRRRAADGDVDVAGATPRSRGPRQAAVRRRRLVACPPQRPQRRRGAEGAGQPYRRGAAAVSRVSGTAASRCRRPT